MHRPVGRGRQNGRHGLAPFAGESLAKFGRVGAKRRLNGTLAQFDPHPKAGVVSQRELQLDARMGGIAHTLHRIQRGLDRRGGVWHLRRLGFGAPAGC